MGVAFGSLINKKEISLDFLRERKVGVDSYNIIYQFLSSIRGPDGTPLMDSKGNVTSHLTGLLYRTSNWLEKGIKPVFVFDGPPIVLKSKTLEDRIRVRTDAKEKHEKALKEGNMEDAKKYGSRALHVTKDMVDDAKFLIKALGLPVIQAPHDGEAQISFMVDNEDLYGAISQDYDVLLYGGKRLLRNIATSGKKKLPGRNVYVDVAPEIIEETEVEKQLGINREKLIWLGILIGTDFNQKFPKIGPKTALKLVKSNNSFEDIIKETKFEPDFDYNEIVNIFMNPASTCDYRINFSVPDNEKVKKFLCDKHDFSEQRVDSVLEKIKAINSEKTAQTRLDMWG